MKKMKKPKKQPIKSKVIVQVYKDDDVSDTCRLTFEVWFHKWKDSLTDREMGRMFVSEVKDGMWEAWKAAWMMKHQMEGVV